MNSKKNLSGFEKRTLKKRKSIEETVLEYLLKGDLNFTMDILAKDAGVSKVSIYNYYDSRKNLVAIVWENFLDNQNKKLDAIVENEENFTDKLKLFLEYKVEFIKNNKLRVWYDLINENEKIAESWQAWQKESFIKIKYLIEMASDENQLNSNYSTDLIIDYLSLIQTGLQFSKSVQKKLNNSKYFSDMLELIWSDVIKEK